MAAGHSNPRNSYKIKNMKIKITYLTLALLALLTGCDKHPVPNPGPDASSRSYIFFSQSIDTKASLVTTSNMGSAGLVGYMYDGTWESTANTAATDRGYVFYDNNVSVPNETMTVSADGTCSYEPLQVWRGQKTYSFFAYYPLGNNSVVLNTAGNAPTITYTMDATSAENLKSTMVDVVTAACKDVDQSDVGNKGDLELEFNHRLSCLAVQVKNTSSGTITLNSIILNIAGIKNNSITIPLDGSTPTPSGPPTAISVNLLPLTPTITEKVVVANTTKELSDKLLFIPQSDNITITGEVNYTREASGYTDNTSTITLPAKTTPLAEGKKQLLQLNFTESTVTATIAPTTWVAVDVYNTFN